MDELGRSGTRGGRNGESRAGRFPAFCLALALALCLCPPSVRAQADEDRSLTGGGIASAGV